ncbi:MAG: hypothetical protein NZ482_03720 [Gloeomargarita sp. SKYG98]|nr:hypothetical protein [Gloeomargarita sp. SKYG98]
MLTAKHVLTKLLPKADAIIIGADLAYRCDPANDPRTGVVSFRTDEGLIFEFDDYEDEDLTEEEATAILADLLHGCKLQILQLTPVATVLPTPQGLLFR